MSIRAAVFSRPTFDRGFFDSVSRTHPLQLDASGPRPAAATEHM